MPGTSGALARASECPVGTWKCNGFISEVAGVSVVGRSGAAVFSRCFLMLAWPLEDVSLSAPRVRSCAPVGSRPFCYAGVLHRVPKQPARLRQTGNSAACVAEQHKDVWMRGSTATTLLGGSGGTGARRANSKKLPGWVDSVGLGCSRGLLLNN